MDRVVVAEAVAAQGLKGEVRLKIFTEDPRAILDYQPLTAETGRVLKITALRALKNIFAARIEGVTNRTQAEALVGLRFFVDRSVLPKTEENEFYHADLVGLTVVDTSGAEVGTIVGIDNFGAGDLLDVRLAGEPRTAYVPFTKSIVPRVDLTARRVIIVPPPGLLDDPSKEQPPSSETKS